MKNIKKFHTDSDYLSKDELKHMKDVEFSSDFWNEVLKYREKYIFEIPLLFSPKKNVRLTQTPWILQKEIKMISNFSTIQQKMLTNISTKYSSTTLLEDINNKSLVADIHFLLNANTKKTIVSRTIIENLVNEIDEPTTIDEKNIVKLYDNLMMITNKFTSPREVAKIFFKINELKNKNDDDIHTSLIETIKSDGINSLLTKISALIFSILRNNMFGEYSYEIAILSLMSLLRNSYKGEILKGISLIKTFEYFKLDIEKAVKQVEDDKGDLTYLTQLLITILMYCVRLSSEQIEKFIKDETRYNSLSTKDKNNNIKNIMKSYPELSQKQVKFFVAHSDRRSNYTVKDFQEYFGTSYETARYSLDKLVDSGFYKKKKVGKKYVYNAIRQ